MEAKRRGPDILSMSKVKLFKVLSEEPKAIRISIMPGLIRKVAADGYDPQRTGYTDSLAQLFIVLG